MIGTYLIKLTQFEKKSEIINFAFYGSKSEIINFGENSEK